MPKGSPELTSARKEEIIDACEKLFRTMSFSEIAMKDIASATTFTRTSIYNYFETKEEIFLALFEREYRRWIQDLEALLERNGAMDGRSLADGLASSLERREQLLKLLSMNLYDMEGNSRMERLVSFKEAFGRSMDMVGALLRRFRPDMDEREREDFIYVFFPFIYGIYPYTTVTAKQHEAMRKAGIAFRNQSVYDLAYACLRRLIGV